MPRLVIPEGAGDRWSQRGPQTAVGFGQQARVRWPAVALASALSVGAIAMSATASAWAAGSKSAYVVDNFSNQILQYNVTANGTLAPKSPGSVAAAINDQGFCGAPHCPGTVSPMGLTLSPDGKSAYVPNFADGGSISQFSVAADGALSSKSPAFIDLGLESNSNPLIHQIALGPEAIAVTPDGKYAYAVVDSDLRFGDPNLPPGILQFKVARDGTLALTPALTHTGASPLDIKVSTDGRSAYAAASGEVDQYNIATDGTLSPKTPASVPASGNTEIALSADGRSAYVAGASGVDQYSIATDGRLSPKTPATVAASLVGFPLHPFALSPDRRHAYGVGAGGIVTFNMAADGSLTLSPLAAPADNFPANAGEFTSVALSAGGTDLYTTNLGGGYVAGSGFPIGSDSANLVLQYEATPSGALSLNSPSQIVADDPASPFACGPFGCSFPIDIVLN